MHIDLYSAILESVKEIVHKQNEDGSFPAGHNGPYKDPETSVRNTAHWCISLLKAYEITEDKDFLTRAKKCGNYLMDEKSRPMNSIFFCRKKPDKDFSNGLVGQAWAIEALVELTKITKDEKYIQLAIQVFLMHPYDDKYGAWIRKNVDGSLNGFDRTFNHQLWFAAVGGMLTSHNQKIQEQVTHFMDRLDDHFETYRDGCIRHAGKFLLKSKLELAKGTLQKLLESSEHRTYMRMKSAGYHGFNLYAFGLLKQVFANHIFWETPKFKKALAFAASDSFKKELENSKYGFPYNPPGFEMGFAFQEFNYLSEDKIAEWVSFQISKCYDFETNLMTEGGTFDPETAAARIYESTRLKNYILKVGTNEF